MINLWPLLLPLAAYSGWFVAKKQIFYTDKDVNTLSREYVVGLNYLLNEQPDKAVDLFISLLEVDSDTVETHLALGSLFRRRGEVDRAIRLHQNLIARPQLSALERKESLMALGQDYMSAGVFDRAEKIFLEVVELGSEKDISSLRGLLDIYQQEKAWEKALDIVKKLEISTKTSMHIQAAHYYCEIAQQALKQKLYDKAQQSIKYALSTDRQSVRASLMLADIEIKNGRYKQAIRVLKNVSEQDVEFINEIVEPLVECHRQLNTMDECVSYLESILVIHPRASVIFVIAEHLMQSKSTDYALDFVANQLSIYPSIRGLNRLIYWHLGVSNGKLHDKLQMLYSITSKLLENKPIYRCGHCGFSGKLLHWHCPSCKQWGSTKPIYGLEGD